MKKLTHIPLERGGVRVGGSPRLEAVGIVVPCFRRRCLATDFPPRVCPSQFFHPKILRRARKLPTSLRRGEGRMQWVRVSE